MSNEKVSYQQFWRDVTQDGRLACALEGTPCHRCHGEGRCLRCVHTGVIPCSGILDAHHFVPKRRLRTAIAKTDVRNGIPLCRDHHDLVEQGFLLSPRPGMLEFFLADHGVSESQVPDSCDPPLRVHLLV